MHPAGKEETSVWIWFGAPAALLIGVVVGLVVVSGHWELLVRQETAVSARTQVWLVAIGAQAVLWVFIIAGLVSMGRGIHELCPLPRGVVAVQAVLPVSVIAGLLAILIYARSSPTKIGAYELTNLPFIGIAGMLVAAACVCGMYWAGLVLEQRMREQDLAGRISDHMTLHGHLRGCLLGASLTLGLGVLTSAALRNAVNAGAGTEKFQAEYVIAYGVVNSVFLAAAFVPVQWAFWRRASELAEEFARPKDGSSPLTDRYEKEAKIEAMLGAGWSGAGSLASALLTLGPALLGWVGSLLSTKAG